MATIKVDSTAMRDKATTFRTIASNISSYTDQMEQEINGMKSVWEGEAAESTVAKFAAFKESFEEKKKAIENYATFLENAAEAYDNSENSITNAGK